MIKTIINVLILCLMHCNKNQQAEKSKVALDELSIITDNVESLGEMENMENAIKLEYEKMFGKPITDFELSIKRVSFHLGTGPGSVPPNRIIVTMTPNGVFAEYFQYEEIVTRATDGTLDYRLQHEKYEATLDLGEWLNFINKLYCYINKWDRSEGAYREWHCFDCPVWVLNIFFSDKEELNFSGNIRRPPNWEKIVKIMNDMEIKIKNTVVVTEN
ncbi:MAG: hypothetical protein LBU83_00715 [Bacteroidales bacterium]|nr:hypothetical protein [Bacteroidales bacterium]